MSKTVIKIEDVSKMYRLGEVGTGTLTHDLQRTWAKLTGKPDPFAKVGVSNDREQKGGDYVWALKDINLEVKEGEILGIIGRNGAGKSTLLKLLSRVTAPTTGRILTKGRIASLLEVGTGFHPELTGRENIYLNGAILGMTRQEITKQLEEIIAFSGCGKYIDTPVKRYSSGMQVRLGFAVAAHLECEILIIDEVLAVGDMEFQKKCLRKMQDIGESNKTILFVSHNMNAVASICKTSVIINAGQLDDHGPTNQLIKKYMQSYINISSSEYFNFKHSEKPFIKEAKIKQNNSSSNQIEIHKEFSIYTNIETKNVKDITLSIQIFNSDGLCVGHFSDEFSNDPFFQDGSQRECILPPYSLSDNTYSVSLFLGKRNYELYEALEHCITFSVAFSGLVSEKTSGNDWKGILGPGLPLWKNNKISNVHI